MLKTSSKLTVAEYMQRDVVTIGPSDTLRDALKLMTENHVTGLPVMDERSRCIGLITASDILSYQAEHAEDSTGSGTTQFFDPETQQWEDIPLLATSLEDFGDVLVSDVMTRDLIWVSRTMPLQEAASRMIKEHVHRVLVLDKESRLYGIISAYDFVRVVAGA
jgi:CBS domain-containing protein